jgi:hypothetical protein
MAPGKARVLRSRRGKETVLVVVRRGCVLHHDGRTYGEGELLQLKLEEVAKLEEHGVVSRRG